MDKEQPKHGLHKNVARAAQVREMCNTPGFKIVQEEIEAELKRVSEKFIDVKTDEQEALRLRQEAQVWVSLQRILKKVMLTGEFSARALQNLEPSTDLR